MTRSLVELRMEFGECLVSISTGQANHAENGKAL